VSKASIGPYITVYACYGRFLILVMSMHSIAVNIRWICVPQRPWHNPT